MHCALAVVVCVYALRIREAERERRRALREGGRDCARERERVYNLNLYLRDLEKLKLGSFPVNVCILIGHIRDSLCK